jgi:SAM-dependent methyltransferase
METLLSEKISGQAIGCPVCGSKRASFLREAFDDRYGQPDLFSLVGCVQCGHMMTAPRLAESELGALYGTYYPRKAVNVGDLQRIAAGSSSFFAPLKRWLLGTVNQGQYLVRSGERLLDVGSGSCLSLLEARELGAEVWGVEADPNVQRIAELLQLRVYHGSLLDFPFPEITFDLIVLNQVIEHIPEPDATLLAIRQRLAEGGRLVLVFPNVQSFWCRLSGARWINWHIPYHLHHFSRSGMVRMAQRCGYQVRMVRTITPNLWTVLQLRVARAVTVRGVPSAVWAVSADPAADAPSVPRVFHRTLSGALKRALLAVLLTVLVLVNRTIDALGLGDSVMMELTPTEQE